MNSTKIPPCRVKCLNASHEFTFSPLPYPSPVRICRFVVSDKVHHTSYQPNMNIFVMLLFIESEGSHET